MSDAVFLLCEGQGSVVPGKGKDLFETAPAFHDAFLSVQALSEIDLADISWGPSRFRTKSDPHLAHVYSFAHQYAQFKALEAMGFQFRGASGHSLGELIALCLCGGLSLEEGFAFVDRRGRLFARNAREVRSDMLALIGEKQRILELVERAPGSTGIHLANFNTPTQIVVAVSSDDVPTLVAHFQAGGIRTIPLQLGNGCHSPFVAGIDGELRELVDGLAIRVPILPFHTASFGKEASDPDEIRRLLREHLLAPVPWCASFSSLLARGGAFVELGYAKVLKGTALEIDRTADVRMFEAASKGGPRVA